MKGLLVVLTGPSGVGKNAICAILAKRLGAGVTISSTTRPPRLGEKDGRDYFFLSRDEFERQIACGEFLEYATYGGNLYGTNRRMLEELLAKRSLVLADLDIQGCRQLRDKGIRALICPILPEDIGVLMERIMGRGANMSSEELMRRIATAEIEFIAIRDGEFGQPIINHTGRLEEAVGEIQNRIIIHLLKRPA